MGQSHPGDTAILSIRCWGFLPETPLSQHFPLLCFVLCFGFGGCFALLSCVFLFHCGFFCAHLLPLFLETHSGNINKTEKPQLLGFSA